MIFIHVCHNKKHIQILGTNFILDSTGSGGTNIFRTSVLFRGRRLTGENSSSNTCSSKLSRVISISGRDLVSHVCVSECKCD